MVTPLGQCSWKDVSFHGRKCFTWHSANPCIQAASMVGCMHFSTSSTCARLSVESWTVSDATSILSEMRWQPFGRRKSIRLTKGRFCRLLTVLHLSTTGLGKTYLRVLQDCVQEIRQWSAFCSTWQAMRNFSWSLLGQCVIPRFCRKPTCWTWSCNKLWSHAAASNSLALLEHVKTKCTDMFLLMLWSTNLRSTIAFGNKRHSPTPASQCSKAFS